MDRPEYIQLLSPAERAMSIKMGMLSKLASHGVAPSQAAAFFKSGQATASPLTWLKNLGGWGLALSVLAGAPIGAAAHGIERKITKNTPEEKERLARIKYYNDIASQLESGLARTTE